MPQRIEFIRAARPNYQIKRKENRPNGYQRGYSDKRHAAWRRAVLLRDNWTCRACGHVCGERGNAHADHVSPVVPGAKVCADGRSRYDVDGGQCLCHSCHSKKTAGETATRVATGERAKPTP